jgi:hypothetical protein
LETGSEIESLLLEDRFIREYGPEINIQREVAEGTSRYGAPLLPVAMVEPSRRRRRVEVFFFASDREAVQLCLDPRRPARRLLLSLVEFFDGHRSSYRKSSSVTDWGTVGSEICQRYFGRSRDRAHWIELARGHAWEQRVDMLIAAARGRMSASTEPGEVRETRMPGKGEETDWTRTADSY